MNLFIVLGFMEITYEPYELGTLNLVWRQIVTIRTNSAPNVVHI